MEKVKISSPSTYLFFLFNYKELSDNKEGRKKQFVVWAYTHEQ